VTARSPTVQVGRLVARDSNIKIPDRRCQTEIRISGTFHQISKKHLPLYLAEFDHRFNHCDVTDGERTVSALKLAEGKRLTLKPLKGGKRTQQ